MDLHLREGPFSALTLKKPSDLRASRYMSKSQAAMRRYRRSAESVKGYEGELIERLRGMPVDPQRTSLLKHWDESERKMPHGRLSPKQWFQVLQHVPLERAVKTKTAKGDTGLMVYLESLIRFAAPDDNCGMWLSYFRRVGKLNPFQRKAVKELIELLESRRLSDERSSNH